VCARARGSLAPQIPIIEIDVQGTMKLHKSQVVHAQYVFVKPPSVEELERRLRRA
jgi:guanylate kinase